MSDDHDRRRGDDDRGPRGVRPAAAARGRVEIDLTVEASSLGDEELVTLAAGGERTAFAELYRRHEQITWRVARAVTLSDDDAVAAVVEAFSHLLELSPGGVPFRAVLAAAARDGALDQMRRRRAVRNPLTSYIPATSGTATGSGDTSPPDQADDLYSKLPSVVPPPPPELWALVQVAWEDRLAPKQDEKPLARRVVTQLPSGATWHRG